MEISIIDREDLPVMYQVSDNGPATAHLAIGEIEKKLPTLRGRRCFGVYFPETNEYRAVVSILDTEDSDTIGLPTWVLPGGKYARTKIKNWDQLQKDAGKVIGETVSQMIPQINPDPTRPSIEFYKSHTELHILLPIK